ncbi:hypothetical protein BE20_03550 [Sorangium cellulosum]|nr:hypothetical protein BE20_03550 [Sorangium cellulosum]
MALGSGASAEQCPTALVWALASAGASGRACAARKIAGVEAMSMKRNARRKAILVAAVAALALGAAGSGCFWGREEHAPGRWSSTAWTRARAAWSEAEEDGELPIQMWAVEPLHGRLLGQLSQSRQRQEAI